MNWNDEFLDISLSQLYSLDWFLINKYAIIYSHYLCGLVYTFSRFIDNRLINSRLSIANYQQSIISLENTLILHSVTGQQTIRGKVFIFISGGYHLTPPLFPACSVKTLFPLVNDTNYSGNYSPFLLPYQMLQLFYVRVIRFLTNVLTIMQLGTKFKNAIHSVRKTYFPMRCNCLNQTSRICYSIKSLVFPSLQMLFQ